MRYVSLFSGIEAASVAWGPLGWEPVAFSEIEPFPSAVLARRFPDVPNLGDITRVDWREYAGQTDLVVGGSPCQSFSTAGSRTGLDGASGLMWEYVRAVREIRPEWLLWENVPGALSSSHGEDFRCLLESMDELGYGVAWRVLDAQFFGVAQRRRRVFLVGRLGDVEGPCQVLFEPEEMRWDSPSSEDNRKALAAGAGVGSKTAGWPVSAGNIGHEPEQAPTVLAERNDAAVCIKGDIARGARMGQIGKGWIDDGSCYTLTTVDIPAVMHEPVSFAANQRGEVRLQGGDGEVCGVIPANQSGEQAQGVADGYSVRRLTPRECERLMGFPDDWTKVPYRGKTADQCSDTPRYKALGNSMAVPVMAWIGERIAMVEESVR